MKLLMFNLPYPLEHKTGRTFPSIYGLSIIIIIHILADFHKNRWTLILRISRKWRHCLQMTSCQGEGAVQVCMTTMISNDEGCIKCKTRVR